MEKFGTWHDKATGVRPFIPIQKKIDSWKVTVRYILGAIKMLICLPCMFSGNLNPFIWNLIPIRIIAWLGCRVNHIVNFNCIMILLGKLWAKCRPTPLIKKIVPDEKWKKPKPGSIVFAPLSSLLNLVYMSARFSPIYVIPVDKDHGIEYGFLGIALHILRMKDLRKGNKKNLSDIVKAAKRPVVIFGEAAPTNGQGILKFVPFELAIEKDTDVQVLGFSHDFDGVSPNFASGSAFKYVLAMFGTTYAKMDVFTTLEKDKPQHNGKIDAEFIEKVRDIMSKLMHVPVLSIGADDYVGYVESYKKLGKTD